MSTAKARFSAFTSLAQADLVPYAQNIVDTMQSNPTYEPFSGDVILVSDSVRDFAASLANMRTGDKATTILKNQRKSTLLGAMRNLGTKLTLAANGDPYFITNAGYDTYNERQNHLNPINTPIITLAQSTGIRGQLLLEIDAQNVSPGVREHAVETSIDDGATWQNGRYVSKLRTTLTNLPSSLNMSVRIRAIGTRNRVSDYSRVVICGVL